MYELMKVDTTKGEINDCLRRLSDNACIPLTELNADYREYRRLVAAGETDDLGV